MKLCCGDGEKFEMYLRSNGQEIHQKSSMAWYSTMPTKIIVAINFSTSAAS